MENKDINKEIKKALVPYLISVKNAIKSGNKELIEAIKGLEKISVSVDHEIKMPEVQKVDLKTPIVIPPFPEHQPTDLKEITKETKGIGAFLKGIKDAIGKIGDNVFKVRVQNPTEVDLGNVEKLLKDLLKKAKDPSGIKILNSEPKHAIPVVLTDKSLRSFYNAMTQVIAGNDINLQRVIEALENIKIDADSVNLNTDELEEKIDETNRRIGDTDDDPAEGDGSLNGLLKRIRDLLGTGITVAGEVDVTDRAARLLGIVYGNLDQLQQKATTKELLTWVNNFPATQAVSEADGANVSLGAKADASATTDTGTFSFISLFKRLLEKLTAGIQGLVISSVNSTTTPLGSSATFTGTGEDLLSFNEITLNLYATSSAANGTLYFEFSSDNTNWDISIPITISDPTQFVPFPLRVVARYFRVRYANGTTAQTVFRLQTIYHKGSAKHLTRTLTQSLASNEPVEVVKAILAGVDPTSGGSGNVGIVSGGNPLRNSLLVTDGARPSQVPGRTSVNITGRTTADVNARTTTSGKTLYITSIEIIARNDSITAATNIDIRDSASAGTGTIKRSYSVSASTNQSGANIVVTNTFPEPIPFSTGVFIDLTGGTPSMDYNFMGYEETN